MNSEFFVLLQSFTRPKRDQGNYFKIIMQKFDVASGYAFDTPPAIDQSDDV